MSEKLKKEINQDDHVEKVIERIEEEASSYQQSMVPIEAIRPNPYQPRQHFDHTKLNELAQSIQEHGIFQPILLKKSSVQGYEIVAGERRYRASKIVGLKVIPAIIVDFTDQQMMEIALLENIQRENLNAIEEAQAYQAMIEKLHLTQEELAKRIGKSRTHVTNTLRLLKMPLRLQDFVVTGKLQMGHIKPLISLKPERAIEIAQRAIDEELTTREIEDLVKGVKKKNDKKKKSHDEEKQFQYCEALLRKKYGTKVKVDDKYIHIGYTNVNDLNRILELMNVLEDV